MGKGRRQVTRYIVISVDKSYLLKKIWWCGAVKFLRIHWLICGALLSANVYLVYMFHQVGLRPVPRPPSFLYLQYSIPNFTRAGVLEGDESNMLKLRKKSCVLHKNGRFLRVQGVI